MILKETILKSADNSGASTMRVIHLYRFQVKKLGSFCKVVLVRFNVRRKLQKKRKYRGLLITQKARYSRPHGIYMSWNGNRVATYAEKLDKFLGTRLFGPAAREMRNKKLISRTLARRIISLSRALI